MKNKGPLARIWGLAEAKQTQLNLSVVLAILGVIAGFIPYLCAAKIITILLEEGGNFEETILLLTFALVGSLLKVVLTVLSTSISHKATFEVLAEVRNKCLHKLSKLSMGTLQEQPVGKWKSILVDQIESMETTLAHLVPELTSNICASVLLIIAMLFIDWRVALLSIVTLPISMLFMMVTMKSYPKKYGESVEIGQTMNQSIIEYVHGIEVIKAYNQGEQAYQGYEKSVKKNAQFYYDWMRSSQFAMACYRNIAPAVLITVLPFGLIFYMNGSLLITEFIFIVVLSLGVVGPIIASTNFVDSLAQTGTIIDSIEAILEAKEQQHPSQYADLTGRNISFQNVTFSYGGADVLKDISIQIPEGSMSAIVGPSGSGKSTITKLIAAFWDVEKGEITVGDTNIKEIPLEQIADTIAYVSQDNFLFDDTIRENIRMGKENATNQEVEAVARAAGCDGFIQKLEKGYDTRVGSGGTHLSGGERQRITIARAMLKNADIIILDEATAYMDPENEALIQQAIAKLIEGKTLIMIAHRLSTIVNADQIIVVDQGRINEVGTHRTLLKTSDVYRKMWNAHIGAKEEK